MKRTPLGERVLPDYTRGEEIANMTTHIVGGGLGVILLFLTVIISAFNRNVWGIVGSFIYGISMIALYTVSSVYHGLIPETAKKVMQIIDHCSVFLLISGTYTPIALVSLREHNAFLGWGVFGVVWGVSALGITLNAIDLKKYNVFSIICYLAQGWCIILTGKTAIEAIGIKGFWWLLAVGIPWLVDTSFESLFPSS